MSVHSAQSETSTARSEQSESHFLGGLHRKPPSTTSSSIVYTPSQSTERADFNQNINEEEPPDALSPIIPVSADYDLVLELGPPGGKQGYSWGVSQAAMCLSSTVFTELLSTPTLPLDNQKLVTRFVRNGVDVLRIENVEYTLGDDHLRQMARCVLWPIHHIADQLWSKIHVDVLARVCSFAHEFKLIRALKAWLTIWTQNLAIPSSLPLDLRPWLIVTSVLGDHKAFKVCQLQFWWNLNVKHLCDSEAEYPGLLQPIYKKLTSSMYDSLKKMLCRLYKIHKNFASMYTEPAHELSAITFESCPNLGVACNDLRLGGITRAIVKSFGTFEEFVWMCLQPHKYPDHLNSLRSEWALVKSIGTESLKSSHRIHQIPEPSTGPEGLEGLVTFMVRMHPLNQFINYNTVTNTSQMCTANFKTVYALQFNNWLEGEIKTITACLEKPVGDPVATLRTSHHAVDHWLQWETPKMTIP